MQLVTPPKLLHKQINFLKLTKANIYPNLATWFTKTFSHKNISNKKALQLTFLSSLQC